MDNPHNGKNVQGLTDKYVETSLFTLKNNIRPTGYNLAYMNKDNYNTRVNKVGTYYLC